MIRMLLIGYCLGIRSERRLCDEVHLNLAYRWFRRLGLVTLNMRAASACMNEFLLRAYPFRLSPNRDFARTFFSIAGAEEDHVGEAAFSVAPSPGLARGLREPLLGLPALADAGAPR